MTHEWHKTDQDAQEIFNFMLKRLKELRQDNPFNAQSAFMEACGQTVNKENWEQFRLYRDLIDEEVAELNEAHGDADLVEVADAIVDILVVTIGAGLSLGLPMQDLWDEVHRSNMAKVDPQTGHVRKRIDGKILKPEGWQPPDIRGVLTRHQEPLPGIQPFEQTP